MLRTNNWKHIFFLSVNNYLYVRTIIGTLMNPYKKSIGKTNFISKGKKELSCVLLQKSVEPKKIIIQ